MLNFMLGYTELKSSDIYIFFEGTEIETLATKKIQGIYFNIRDPSAIGLLEASVNDKIKLIIDTSANKNDSGFLTWLHLEMKLGEYNILKETGTAGTHDGFRHINLWDSNNLERLNMNERWNYRQLKHYESQVLSQNIQFLPRQE